MTDSPKTALVVGVGPGIGAAAARRLTQEGYKVAVAARTLSKLEPIAEAIGGLAVAMDATDPDSIKAGIAATEEALGPIHTVVWNVGSGLFGTLQKVDLDGLDRGFQTNTRGLFVLAKQLLDRKSVV